MKQEDNSTNYTQTDFTLNVYFCLWFSISIFYSYQHYFISTLYINTNT